MSFDRGRNRRAYAHEENEDQIPHTIFESITEDVLKNNHDIEMRANNKLISKLLECAASHFENNDRIGGLAIMNAINFAIQKE